MKNVSQIKVVERITTLVWCSIIFFRKSCRLWNHVEKYCTAGQATDDITRRMRFACSITKVTNTHPEYVLIAFPRQQWLQERASMLRLYVHCLSFTLWVRLYTLKKSLITCVRRALFFRQLSFRIFITGFHESELSAPRNKERCGI
jgi:hypothetical protein